ncbi:MAG: hypothetical protein N2745_07375 [Syntrophorhabdaceae bacterium]|nr:hypothetical protein [Syntrophorhabdaceae bacterium]
MRLACICLISFLILLGATSCNKEVKGLKEEIRLLREENNFLRAENISLKKELEELYKRLDGKSSMAGKESLPSNTTQKIEGNGQKKAR